MERTRSAFDDAHSVSLVLAHNGVTTTHTMLTDDGRTYSVEVCGPPPTHINRKARRAAMSKRKRP